MGPGSGCPLGSEQGEEAQGEHRRGPSQLVGLGQALQWASGNFQWEVGLKVRPLSMVRVPSRRVASDLTIKDSPAVLGGGGQRQAGRIELVAVVPDADLELNGIVDILQHGG